MVVHMVLQAPPIVAIRDYDIRGDSMANELAVRTDKGEYVGGDTIYGSVYLCIGTPTPSRAVRLVFRGLEISEYDYQYVDQATQDKFVSKVGQRTAKKDIVKAEIKLIEYPGGFSVGYYSYPFQYQLPHNLPGVFHTRHEDQQSGRVWEGIIKYHIGATLDQPDVSPDKRLSAEAPLVIYDCLDCCTTGMIPDKQTASGNVKTFFCIQRGEVRVTTSLDGAAYSSKDKIGLMVKIDNQSAVDIAGSTIRLIRVIKLYGTDRNRGEEDMSAHTLYDTVIELNYDGCAKNNNSTKKVTIDLTRFSESPVGLPPSTSGSLIKCSYVIDVDVHVPWAPDIEVRQPLLIKPPPNVIWESWHPPSWVADCKQAPVTGSCAVPPDVLTSQSFVGIPGFQPVL